MGSHTKVVDTSNKQSSQLHGALVNGLLTGGYQQMPTPTPAYVGGSNIYTGAPGTMAPATPGAGPAPGAPTDFMSGIFGQMPATPPGVNVAGVDKTAGDIVGPNSYFTLHVLPTLNNLFNQTNSETAAQAKETAGNLTGSGFANTLATALNRNKAQQQATLMSTIQNLIGQQTGVNTTNAQLAQQNNLAQFAAALGLSQQNAANLLALLQSQSTVGVGQGQAVTSPGIGAMLPGLATAAATAYAGR